MELIDTNMSRKTYNALFKASIMTTEDLHGMKESELKAIRGIGDEQFSEILSNQGEYGFRIFKG